MVKQDEVGLGGRRNRRDFFDLPGANEGSRIRTGAALDDLRRDSRSGARNQFAKLGHRLVDVQAARESGRRMNRRNFERRVVAGFGSVR